MIDEKEYLEDIIGFQVREGRQHYLKFEIPITWQIWSDNGMEMDCTLGYPDKEGFRCGTCYEFPVFNIITSKHVTFKDPLIVMEGTLVNYQDYTLSKMAERFRYLMIIVKKYHGNFVILWHNSCFNVKIWNRYNEVYCSLIE